MEVYIHPHRCERFELSARTNPFEDLLMLRNCHHPFNFYGNEGFPLLDLPVHMRRRIYPHNIHLRRCRKEEQKNHEGKSPKMETGNEEKNSTPSEIDSKNKFSENEENVHQSRKKFLGNLINFEEIFPRFNELSSLMKSSDKGPFELNVNLHGCNPEEVKVEIKDGVIKVEGRRETSDGSFTYVRHEQSIPKNVPANKLKASLLPEGVLKIQQEESCNIPVTIETEKEDSNSDDETKNM